MRVFDRNAKRWNDDAIIWTFEGKEYPWDHSWADLSDVKIRKTRARGLIALVVASGGAAGVVDIKKRGEHTDSRSDLIWAELPDDNPHSIERVPHNGSILTVSSQGDNNLQLYSPRNPDNIDDFDNYERVRSWTFAGAHGIHWCPYGGRGLLWVLGDGKLVAYEVKGSGLNTDLDVYKTVPIKHAGPKMGHDLQPDYANPGHLLVTDSQGVYRFHVDDEEIGAPEENWAKKRVKSIAHHPSGEYVYVVGSKETGEMGTHVSFADNEKLEVTDERGWSDARFYKARIFTPEYV
ncbi:hypothetical protein EIL87_01420 [Saccharopolyspora rhizosphaerae]|uniref:WD40 repeat domain-containing protein n=1 Tax=Saccharopolyspora rhizosphaerae TaxID=2492662 RepID=A0A3R8PB86_9PSEU|nr:hypothetical protein [Saccharopolyspora rhizosphaerae]RRO20570.1 hypothetical protein EIL87_01420 [Saccharopolyspora rhizosphaerae]